MSITTYVEPNNIGRWFVIVVFDMLVCILEQKFPFLENFSSCWSIYHGCILFCEMSISGYAFLSVGMFFLCILGLTCIFSRIDFHNFLVFPFSLVIMLLYLFFMVVEWAWVYIHIKERNWKNESFRSRKLSFKFLSWRKEIIYI